MSVQKYNFQNSIGFLINRTAKDYVKALDSHLRQKVGVTVGQWKVLVMLADKNGLTQKEIADRLGLEGATLIPVIDKMEKDKLLVRKVDPADRPNNRIYRTDSADALWDRMIQCASDINEISLEGIPEENIKIIRAVLENIWQNLRQDFDVDCTNVEVKNNQNVTTATTSIKRGLTTRKRRGEP